MEIALLDEQEIRYKVSQIQELPVLSLNLRRILENIASEVCSSDELEAFIRYDQTLTARVLRIANSGYCGFRGKVSSVSDSIMILGYGRVKSICVWALLSDIFSKNESIGPNERERLWKHAFVTGRIASEIVAKRPWISKKEAQILGLLHDLGRLVVAVHFNEQYNLIREIAGQSNLPERFVEPQFGLSHTMVGKWLSIRWAFPELFQVVMVFHHEPLRAPAFRSEATIIALANILANSKDYPEYLNDYCTLRYREKVMISEEEWSEHQERLNEIWSEVDQFWSLLASPTN